MWRLGADNHPLLPRLYRFRQPPLEAQFEAGAAARAMPAVRIHCLTLMGVFAASLVAQVTFPGGLTIVFWLHLFIAASALGLLLGTVLCPQCRRRVVSIHGVYCCVVAGVLIYLLYQQPYVWRQQFFFVFGTPLAALHPGPEFTLELPAFLGNHYTRDSIHLTILETIPQYTILAMVGLTPWAVVAYGVTWVAFVGCISVCPFYSALEACVDSLIVSAVTAGFFGLCVVMERFRRGSFLSEHRLAIELRSSQLADSILNHTLKNILADVAANLEIFLGGEVGQHILDDSIACLRRGMRACKERQVYLKLVAGDYQPVLNLVNLRDLGVLLGEGRDLELQPLDLTVYLDSALCSLILENAISNAFKHGHPTRPNVRFVMQELPAPALPAGWRRISLEIHNTVDPDRPRLTAEDVERLFNGEAKLVGPVVVSALSDRIGMSHCTLAARLAGIRLTLLERDDIVVFQAVLDVQALPETPELPRQATVMSEILSQFPPGLHFCCIDDSAAARRLLEFHIVRSCQPASVRCFGEAEPDVARFLTAALAEADVVLLDQHLVFEETYYGTDLAAYLLQHGFQGLVCIRSANDSPEDRAKYQRCGAHCTFGKDVAGPQLMDELRAAYVQFRSQAPGSLMRCGDDPVVSLPGQPTDRGSIATTVTPPAQQSSPHFHAVVPAMQSFSTSSPAGSDAGGKGVT